MSKHTTTIYTTRLFSSLSFLFKIITILYIIFSSFISLQLYSKLDLMKKIDGNTNDGALIAHIEANKGLTGITYIDHHFIQEIDSEAEALQTLIRSKNKDYPNAILLYTFITVSSAVLLILALISVDKLLNSLQKKKYFESQHPETLKHIALLLLILSLIRGIYMLEIQITLPLIAAFLFLLADIFKKGSELDEEVNLTI